MRCLYRAPRPVTLRQNETVRLSLKNLSNSEIPQNTLLSIQPKDALSNYTHFQATSR